MIFASWGKLPLIPFLSPSKRMMVPRARPLVYFEKRVARHFPNGYCCGLRSSVMASSSVELSMTPPFHVPPLTLEMIVTLSAQDRRANFPIPFLPMNGRPSGDEFFQPFL